MRLKTLLEVSAERVALMMGGRKEEEVSIIIIGSTDLLLADLIRAVANQAPPILPKSENPKNQSNKDSHCHSQFNKPNHDPFKIFESIIIS